MKLRMVLALNDPHIAPSKQTLNVQDRDNIPKYL